MNSTELAHRDNALDYDISMALHKLGVENFYVPLNPLHWVVTDRNRVLTQLPVNLIPRDSYKFPAYDLADLLELVSQLKSFLSSKDVQMELNIDLISREVNWFIADTPNSIEFPIATIGCSILNDLRDGLGLAVVGIFGAAQVVWVEEFLLEPKVSLLLSDPDYSMRYFNKITSICTKKGLEPIFKNPDIEKMYKGI